MKKTSRNNVTTVRLPALAEALLMADVEERQGKDPNVTKTDVLVECIIEQLMQKNPERALRALMAAAVEDPQLRYALEIANSSGDSPDKKIEAMAQVIAGVVAARQRGRGQRQSDATHEQSLPARPVLKKKSRR